MSKITDAVDAAEASELDMPGAIRAGGSPEWDAELERGATADALRLGGAPPTLYVPRPTPESAGDAHFRGRPCFGVAPHQSALRRLEEFMISDLPEQQVVGLIAASQESFPAEGEAALDAMEARAQALAGDWSKDSGGAAVIDRHGGAAVWCDAGQVPVIVYGAVAVVLAAATSHPLQTLVRFIDLHHVEPTWASTARPPSS
ncbi:MAG: hypothetical protein AAF938_23370 [Myxococcota bacterium]